MCIYSLKTKTRMVLHRLRFSQEQLAVRLGVTTRHVYNLLNGTEEKRRVVPKGADEIQRLFDQFYPDPVPAHLRRLSDRIHKIAWLKSSKARYREELIGEIVHGLDICEFYEEPGDAPPEEMFVRWTLRGHVYFAAACDISIREKDHEHAARFAAGRRPEYMRKAVHAFENAARSFAFASQPVHMRDRYRLFWATTMCNLGVSIFRAWSEKLIPSLTLQGVQAAFAEHEVGDAMLYLYRVDPKDPAVPFNMCCWTSALEDAEGCRQWFARLVEVAPALRDFTCKLDWMGRPMADSPVFAFLIETVAPARAGQAA